MNKFQAQYAVAKAKYATVIELENEAIKEIEHLMDENQDLYIEKAKEIARRLQRRQTFEALRTAENAMIEWANQKVSKNSHFTSKHQEAINEIMENIWKTNVRAKMVNLAFHLA